MGNGQLSTAYRRFICCPKLHISLTFSHVIAMCFLELTSHNNRLLITDLMNHYFMTGQTIELSNRGRSKGPTLIYN